MLILKRRKVSLRSVAFSPDGTRLAATGQRGFVQVWDLATRKLDKELSSGRSANEGVLYLSPTLLAVAGYRLHLLGLDPPSLRTLDGVFARHAALSPDRSAIVAAVYRAVTRHAMPDATKADWAYPPPSAPLSGFSSVAWSPCGRLVAAGRYAGTVAVLDAATGAERASVGELGTAIVNAIAFSPDGSRLAWCAATNLHIQLPGGRLAHHRLGKTHFHAIAWHPSGAFLATANGDGAIDHWDGVTGERRDSLGWGVGKLYDVAFDADGGRGACCSVNGDVVVWDVDH